MRRTLPLFARTHSVVAFVIKERYGKSMSEVVGFDLVEEWVAVLHIKKTASEIVVWRKDLPGKVMSKPKGKKRIKNDDMTVRDAMWVAMEYLQELIDQAHPILKNWKPKDDDCNGPEPPPYPKILWRFYVAGIG